MFNHFNPGLFTCYEKIMTNPRIFQVECNEISLDLREINKNRKNLDRDIHLETTNEINGLSSQKSRNDNLNLFRNSEDDLVELEYANLNLAVNINAGGGISKSSAHKTVDLSDVRHSEDIIKVKKKIPGPAGTLPKLKEGQNINENLIQQINSKAKKRNHKDSINESQLSQVNSEHSLQNRTWSCAISDLDSCCPALFSVLNRFSLASVPKRVKMKSLPSCKVPIICASITSITLHNIDASVVLKDPSGSMQGALHREIVKEYGDSIYVGTVFVLKQVGVFSPALGRNCYLNITPNNLVRIYTRKVIGSQENSDSVIKVQDPDFSELAAFSENVMRLSDASCSSCLTSPNPVSIKSNPFHQSKISNSSDLASHNLPLSVQSKGNMVSPIGVKKPECEMGGMPNVSQELLDDWIEDEEFVLAASQQEKRELLTAHADSHEADFFHRDDTKTFQKPTNSKPKATSTFAIESNDDFMLSFGPSSIKKRDSNKSTFSANRVQHQEESFEASKKSKFSTPNKPISFPPAEVGLMRSSFTPQCTKTPVNSSPNLPSQPIKISQPAKSNFKFMLVTHSVSSKLSSQSIFSQDLKSDSQFDAASCKNSGQKQSSISNHTDGESLEKLLEGLTDELMDDF